MENFCCTHRQNFTNFEQFWTNFEIVHTSHLEDDFEIFCGIVYTIMNFRVFLFLKFFAKSINKVTRRDYVNWGTIVEINPNTKINRFDGIHICFSAFNQKYFLLFFAKGRKVLQSGNLVGRSVYRPDRKDSEILYEDDFKCRHCFKAILPIQMIIDYKESRIYCKVLHPWSILWYQMWGNMNVLMMLTCLKGPYHEN